MCIRDKKYCRKIAQHGLYSAAIAKTNKERENFLNLAAVWIVMWAGAK